MTGTDAGKIIHKLDRATFDSIDADGSGTLDQSELARASGILFRTPSGSTTTHHTTTPMPLRRWFRMDWIVRSFLPMF